MKRPLLVLAVTACAMFVMGWIGHRVFINSADAEREEIISTRDTDTISLNLDEAIVLTPPAQPVSEAAKEDSVQSAQVPPANQASYVSEKIIEEDSAEEIRSRKKFMPAKFFNQLSVRVEKIKKRPSQLNYSTSKYAKLYRAATMAAVKSGVDFGGHYAFASIPCGHGCFSSTLTDMKTGKVYDGPHASFGYEFKTDSRLLIVNPPDEHGTYEACEDCEPQLWIWNGKLFKRIQ